VASASWWLASASASLSVATASTSASLFLASASASASASLFLASASALASWAHGLVNKPEAYNVLMCRKESTHSHSCLLASSFLICTSFTHCRCEGLIGKLNWSFYCFPILSKSQARNGQECRRRDRRTDRWTTGCNPLCGVSGKAAW